MKEFQTHNFSTGFVGFFLNYGLLLTWQSHVLEMTSSISTKASWEFFSASVAGVQWDKISSINSD